MWVLLFCRYLAIVAVIATTVLSDAAAQRTPKRGMYLPSVRARRMVCEDSLQMFQIKSPILTSLPPLQTNMPLDVLVAYIGADSIARTATPRQMNGIVDSMFSLNDTLKQFGKYLYQVVDWNPVLFMQYQLETQYRRKGIPNDTLHFVDENGNPTDTAAGALPDLYRIGLTFAIPAMRSKYVKYAPSGMTKEAARALLVADYVLRVRVDSVDSCRNYQTPESTALRFSAYATVLDTLKGKVFPNLCQNRSQYLQPYQQGLRNKEDVPQPHSSSPGIACNKIRFEYWKGAYRTGDYTAAGLGKFYRDTVFLDQEQHFTIPAGTECIVFLQFHNPLVDDDYDYFNLDLGMNSSYGILRISDNTVVDLNKVWWPSNLTAGQFTTRFNQLVQQITNP